MNPHEGSTSSVFETDASAYSATPAFLGKAGGVDGIRTHGFYLAKVTLSQLSYDPNNSDVLYHKGFKGSSTKIQIKRTMRVASIDIDKTFSDS